MPAAAGDWTSWLMAPVSALVAPYGARIAHGLNTRHLKRVFAVFLGFTALRMF